MAKNSGGVLPFVVQSFNLSDGNFESSSSVTSVRHPRLTSYIFPMGVSFPMPKLRTLQCLQKLVKRGWLPPETAINSMFSRDTFILRLLTGSRLYAGSPIFSSTARPYAGALNVIAVADVKVTAGPPEYMPNDSARSKNAEIF